MEIKSAKQTKKEYAEKPFDFFILKMSGGEITIEESLDFSNDKPRVVVVKNFKDPLQTHEAIAIKVTDGLFSKELHMKQEEWTKLCAALPSTLLNLRGVTFKVSRGPGFDTKVEYLRTAIHDFDGKLYNPAQDASGQTITTPNQVDTLVKQLAQAIELNAKLQHTNDAKTVMTIADSLHPGHAMDLIMGAKAQGWIVESNGIFRCVN